MKEDLPTPVIQEGEDSPTSEEQVVEAESEEIEAPQKSSLYKKTARMAKKLDRGLYYTGYVVSRPVYQTRKRLTRLESWNPLVLIENSLRKRGIITEGYDYDRDEYVRRVNVWNMSISYVLHRFEGGHYKVPSNPIARIPPKYKLVRPGMSPLYFGNLRDLFEGMNKVFTRPGFGNYPEAPFILQDQHKKSYAILSPERLALRLQDKQIPFPG